MQRLRPYTFLLPLDPLGRGRGYRRDDRPLKKAQTPRGLGSSLLGFFDLFGVWVFQPCLEHGD